MIESAAKSFAARGGQAIDLNEFEQRLRGEAPRPPGHDPLAELATLVNSAEDPFRDLFAEPVAAPEPAVSRASAPPSAPPVPQPPRPMVPPSHLGDEQWQQPAPQPDVLREYAHKMRAPASPVQIEDMAAADDFYGIEPVAVAAPGRPAVRPSPPLAPELEQLANLMPSPASVPAVRPRPPLPELPRQTSATPLASPAPALRGALPPPADPLDEFERSVADLVAARGQASLAPAISDSAYAAQHQAGHADYQPADYFPHELPHEVPDDGYGRDISPAGGYADADPYVPVGVAPRGLTAEPVRRPAVPPQWTGDAAVPPPPPDAEAHGADGRSRKPMYLMGGALAVLVAGIGVTLAMRDGGPGKRGIPTITAANDKLKVKAAESAAARPVRNVSILQNTSAKPAASKVVTRDEQPIDLAQVPAEPKQDLRRREEELSRKLNLGDRNLTRPIATIAPAIKEKRTASGYFPEPRKVRTVMVRPDGSLIDPTASISKPAPSVAAAPRAAASAPKPVATRAAAPSMAATPPPRVVERVAPARPARVESRRPAAAPAAPRARTAAIDLAPRAQRTPPARGGGFAVQLAAPATESAARSVAGQMKSKFGSVMGGRSPSVQRAVVGSRTVYRVRVNGLSRGDAGKMCSQLQAKGGKCFVARN